VRTGGRQRQPLPLRLPSYAIAARAAGRDATVVDAHFALYARLPLLLPSLRRRPLGVHFHGPWADESRAEREVGPGIAVKRAVERSVYRRAERLVVLSAAFKQVLVERYGISPWRIDVVPPGVDLDAFSPGDRVAARRRLGLPAEGPVVVAARRLVARTGVHVLLEAWASLVSSGQ